MQYCCEACTHSLVSAPCQASSLLLIVNHCAGMAAMAIPDRAISHGATAWWCASSACRSTRVRSQESLQHQC